MAQKITPCLWFDTQGGEAAKFYTSVFENSKVTDKSHFGEAGKEVHHQKPGSEMVVAFQLAGQQFTALNGGPQFKFNEAISFQVSCDGQREIDYFWDALGAGGDPKAQQCGWLKDRFGLSWQIIPSNIGELMGNQKTEKSQRAMKAMMAMKKIDIAALENA